MDTTHLSMPFHSESPRFASVIDARSLNLPNAITLSRFVLALVLFALISFDGFWQTAAIVFVIAALTDFLDGYLARKYGQVTVLGRILDPFVDKIIICGSFIFLMAYPESGVTAWVTLPLSPARCSSPNCERSWSSAGPTSRPSGRGRSRWDFSAWPCYSPYSP